MLLHRSTRAVGVLALALSSACADAPTSAPDPEPPAQPIRVLGVYEVTLTDGRDGELRGSVAPVSGGAYTLTPHTAGLSLEIVSSSSFTEGSRGQGGHRYLTATYRVRNATGASISNLTVIPISNAATIPGTPISSLLQFNGAAADPAIASSFVPTGAATLGGGSGMLATEVDVQIGRAHV